MMNEERNGGDSSLQGKTVLVLEDEPLIAIDLQYSLEKGGATVLTARSVERAEDRIDECVPDAAILDVTLGKNRNCEPVARRLIALGVPFVLHSGDLDRQGELIRRLNAPVMAKPASNAEIMAKLAELLRDQAG